MRCACIDIGSNTTRVLVADVADGGLEEVHQEKAFTRIGKGLGPGGEINEAKIAEVAAVVAAQAASAAALGAVTVRTVATAAIRSAANSEAFRAALLDRVNVEVDLIDGEEEARLAFLGATQTFGERLDGTVAVVDVGGGSSEIAVGTVDDGVSWWASFAIGSGMLADAYLRSDPPGSGDFAAIREHATRVLAASEPPQPGAAVAVGGSATSLRRLVGPVLDDDTVERALATLSGDPCEHVAATFDLDPERVRLLPAGMLVLEAASHALGRPLRLGCGGLREGVLLDLAARSDL